MTWSEIDFHPGDAKLRQFAGLFCGFSLLAAGWQFQLADHRLIATILPAFGCMVLLASLARPASVLWLYQGMMAASFPFGWVTSRFLLGVVYFGLFTPLALFFRLRGRDRLSLRIDPDAVSYWKTRSASPGGERYLRPF